MGWEYTVPTRRSLAWVARSLGPQRRVVDVTRLRGGLTAAMDLVTVAGPDDSQRVVLRRWYIEDATKASLVDREAAGLEALGGSAVPAPELDRGGP